MSALIGLGVVALALLGWGAQRAGVASRASASLVDARRELEGAQAALEERDGALRAAHEVLAAHQAEAERERLAHADALARTRAEILELARSHDAAQERARGQLSSLRRTLAAISAERDELLGRSGAARAALSEAEALRAERAALQDRLTAAEGELARLRAEASRAPSQVWSQRQGELERQIAVARADLAVAVGRAEAAEASAARAGDVDQARVRAERDARVAALEREVVAGRRSWQAAAALGAPELPSDAQIFARGRRVATEAVLRETYIAAQAAAGGIFDARGGVWAWCGNPSVLERLAATAALVASAQVAAALGREPRLFSELYGVYGRHLITLPGADLRLGVTGSRECPALALRLAALRLTGLPAPEAAPPTAPAPIPLDPSRSERLDAWAFRRGAQGVACFGAEGAAGTDSGFAAACAPLVSVVQNLFNRALRDGFAHGFTASWRGEGDETLVARPLEDGVGVVFARFASPPAPRVLDDLVASLRWAPAALARAS